MVSWLASLSLADGPLRPDEDLRVLLDGGKFEDIVLLNFEYGNGRTHIHVNTYTPSSKLTTITIPPFRETTLILTHACCSSSRYMYCTQSHHGKVLSL